MFNSNDRLITLEHKTTTPDGMPIRDISDYSFDDSKLRIKKVGYRFVNKETNEPLDGEYHVNPVHGDPIRTSHYYTISFIDGFYTNKKKTEYTISY